MVKQGGCTTSSTGGSRSARHFSYTRNRHDPEAYDWQSRGQSSFRSEYTKQDVSAAVATRVTIDESKKKILPIAPYGIGLEGIFEAYGIDCFFPTEVLQEVDGLPSNPSPAGVRAQIRHGRRDLRQLLTFTIDGRDAKDLDDALSLQKHPDGSWKLFVHIADVAHYVQANTALDREAMHRATSIYPVDRVIPMLPPELSNGLCSLHPGVDRLTLTVELDFSQTGEELGGKIYESVICSDVRADYVTVQHYFDEGILPVSYKQIRMVLADLRELCKLLMQRRQRDGALQLEIPERKVCLNAQGQVTEIKQLKGDESHEVIEACMVAANIFVAREFEKMGYPFMYRVHEKPDVEKLLRVVRYAQMYGLTVTERCKWQAKDVAALLEKFSAPVEKQVLTQLLLRSLAKAKYSPRCLGHDGLGLTHYCHFTSPIRRYPDLLIHRIIKSYLHGKKPLQKWQKLLPEWAEHCSVRERLAMVVERETVDYKVAEYMAPRVGEVFVAQVTGLLNAGLFVSVAEGAEGFLPFSNMPDHMIFDEEYMVVRGRRSGLVISLGDVLVVRLAAVQVQQRKIDFVLEDSDEYPVAKALHELRQEEMHLRGRFSYRRSDFRMPSDEKRGDSALVAGPALSAKKAKKLALKEKHQQQKKSRQAAKKKKTGNKKTAKPVVAAVRNKKNHSRIDQLLERVHQELSIQSST